MSDSTQERQDLEALRAEIEAEIAKIEDERTAAEAQLAAATPEAVAAAPDVAATPEAVLPTPTPDVVAPENPAAKPEGELVAPEPVTAPVAPPTVDRTPGGSNSAAPADPQLSDEEVKELSGWTDYTLELIRKADPNWQAGDPVYHLEFIVQDGTLRDVKAVMDPASVPRAPREATVVTPEQAAAPDSTATDVARSTEPTFGSFVTDEQNPAVADTAVDAGPAVAASNDVPVTLPTPPDAVAPEAVAAVDKARADSGS